ncbi:MAG: hypothetical protein E6G94_04010 [Alphaproteobacteria bacterium]|nr:MAG: hypothetical protein E6G94_04010 [Alphaproteobacteria bacterium]
MTYLKPMSADRSQPLKTVGLGGDGDEVDAIEAVERHFGVALDYRDAPGWRTAGEVFRSLLAALPPDQRDLKDLWPIFAAIMCAETGADPSRVGPETLLLA